MSRRILILVFCLLTSEFVIAQHFESHIWKDRLIVMLADSPENKSLKKQYQELVEDKIGLKERKLILYLITPSSKSCTFNQVNCISDKASYKALKRFNTNFEIILIGLDGGKKIHRKSPLASQELFNRIDAMPMRAQELKKN